MNSAQVRKLVERFAAIGIRSHSYLGASRARLSSSAAAEAEKTEYPNATHRTADSEDQRDAKRRFENRRRPARNGTSETGA